MVSQAFETSPVSLLDTDLYKLTMQQAVLQNFSDAQATYRFANRSPNMLFSRECIDSFKDAVSQLLLPLSVDILYYATLLLYQTKSGDLPDFVYVYIGKKQAVRLPTVSLTPSEHAWLQSTCPYFTKDYLSYLSHYRFNHDQVTIIFKPSKEDPDHGLLYIEVVGPWVETILWEVPLMSLLSESYFKTVDCDWDYVGQEELAYQKGVALLESDISFTEYGTRRRRSHHTHDLVIRGLKRASEEWTGRTEGKFLGTSNVYLAYKHGLKPGGTIAHEWFMAIGASLGYEHANAKALDLWHEVYGTNLLIALTDTFTTEAFFKDFTRSPERARVWTGLRQDSGDPFVYAPRVKEMYEGLGIDPREKVVVYSDSQNVDLAKRLKKQCNDLGMNALFGIGTNFTNDFRTQSSGGKEKSKALNIVIKIASIDGKPCVKLSDEPTKNTGDPESVRQVKEAFGLEF